MAKKISVAVVFGGKSGEHEVSCRSAEFVGRGLTEAGFETRMVKVGKDGHFDQGSLVRADVIFPIIHGSYGEDGCLQGLLEMYDKAYVGAGVLGSAIGMDKDVQKRLLQQAGIPVARYFGFRKVTEIESVKKRIDRELGWPVFVKPANMGSSVGISLCRDGKEFIKGVATAFRFDTKVMVEERVEGREIEVAVLGDEIAGYGIRASVPGEVIPSGGHRFYDYEAKYIDVNGAMLEIPARGLNDEKTDEIRNLASRVFEILECRGMARVDMFLKPDGRVVVNEINTLPGFTSISMFPKLWAASGMDTNALFGDLIRTAIKARKFKKNLHREYNRD